MKKILSALISLCGIGLVSVAFAVDDFIPFTTIEKAQEYCPALNGLTFIANNRSVPNSAGIVRGNQCSSDYGCKTFESLSTPPKSAGHPKNMDEKSGLIGDAAFRSADGLYGYISNNVITCLYSYPTVFNVEYKLVLRSQR